MEILDKYKFNRVHNKFKYYNIKLTNNISKQEELKDRLISFNDFLINYYLDNDILHKNAIYDNYYIMKGNYLINKFKNIKFNNYEKFLIDNYTHFESITAECIYLRIN
jgi:hypothetical protein